ncbi:MAG: patatin-like phospholipase family protein [Flavobacteriales bacterium]|nr:patatin-like phospholipase family protein [Flavobacteriales bacterium]MBK6943318.1 patatin-like phospholipase family protein [Flavobacteriales bacterium]MBK7240803.1 patatin-like phospholipase family protein [Flavobacteriales bacterium]MBK7296583.1 patatin-like phospholipase family protein [Flavobacteriales bacterium]MBP9139467.1 patatin-like phospholipase family protein [Flavobacteriales bacterium]
MERSLLSILFLIIFTQIHGQKVGMVLSGGGAVGLTHIGVMQALEENDIPIDFITGSSMGALIGGMYAAGYSPWEIDSLFNTDLYKIMADGGIEKRYQYYFKQDAPDASLISVKLDLDTTIQTSLPTNLRKPALLDFEQMRTFGPASAVARENMDSLFVPFRCVASDLTDQTSVTFSRGNLAECIRASMSYPFYFKPISVNGHLMMDGGLYNNFPSDVMYNDFLPDFIIGSNVSYNAPPPTEDDLLSQLRAMMQEHTNYTVICENGVIIEPLTTTTLFDFSNPSIAIKDGYDAAMAQMPEILARTIRRMPRADLEARREAFRARMPKMEFGDVVIQGLTKSQKRYVAKTLSRRDKLMSMDQLKPTYFRLVADRNIASFFPKATYDHMANNFRLELKAKAEKDLEVKFGGMFSSRPINTGMVGLRYNLFGSTSARIEANSYFGKYYIAGQAKLRMDLSTASPLYIEPAFTIHRWDYFRSFTTFFDEVRPSFVVNRETWGGINVGMGLGNKGLLRLDAKIVETKDNYYQTAEFSGQDTADVSYFSHFTSGLLIERNTLNRKQHANAGESLAGSIRVVTGHETTDLGSTRAENLMDHHYNHDWIVAKITLDKYFLPRGIFKFGLLAEGVFSSMPNFENYTESIIRSPAFRPTPESHTYFIPEFRSTKFVAGGARLIVAVAKNRFDLRLEGFVFQPYEPLIQQTDGSAITGLGFDKRYYMGSGSLIYQSPLGPVWFNTSYIDGLTQPWVWSLNFGYILFNQKAQE